MLLLHSYKLIRFIHLNGRLKRVINKLKSHETNLISLRTGLGRKMNDYCISELYYSNSNLDDIRNVISGLVV